MGNRCAERHAGSDANALASLIHVIPARPPTAPRWRWVAAVALFVGLAGLWILGTVPSGGPDEPVHIVRGAALVRGELDGERFAGQGRAFELPGWIGHPDHACFSLIGEQPANCATGTSPRLGDRPLISTATSYPIWGHLAPGLATYLPSSIGNQMARVFDAAIPLALLGAAIALASRRGVVALASTALAVTPMALFSIVVVNPSGLVIAGGIALWCALLSAARGPSRLDRLTQWSMAAGWAAMVLPRRDGMIWAVTVLAIVAVSGRVDLRNLVRRLGPGPLVLGAASTLATMAWAVASGTRSSNLLLVAPLLPVVGQFVHRAWIRQRSLIARISMAVAGVAIAAAVGTAAMIRRPGGFDADMLKRIVDQSGANLEEAIGVLGWLDTPIPRVALLVWVVALGALAGIVLAERRVADLALAAVVVIVAVVSAWVLEMSQGTTTGTYWQGRYFLPLLVGVPLLLGFSDGEPRSARRARAQSGVIVGAAMFVLTMSFAASMRRWGVGTAGSMLPWEWGTYGTWVPPWALLAAHAAIGVELTRRIVREGHLVEHVETEEEMEEVVTQ